MDIFLKFVLFLRNVRTQENLKFCVCIWLLFFFIIYLKGKVIGRERVCEQESSCIYLFIPQISSTARTCSGQSRESELDLSLPNGQQGHEYLSYWLCALAGS